VGLQGQLDQAVGALNELQDRYNLRLEKLRTEVEICNRR
jgi:hypothetical protein